MSYRDSNLGGAPATSAQVKEISLSDPSVQSSGKPSGSALPPKVRITQFHPDKNTAKLANRLKNNTRVYLDGDGNGGPPPRAWQICPIDNPNRNPVTIPFARWGKLSAAARKAGLRPTLQIGDSSIGKPTDAVREAILLLPARGDRKARHKYMILPDPRLVRRVAGDMVSSAYAEPRTRIHPAGTQFQSSVGSRITMRNQHGWSASASTALSAVADVLGLSFSGDLNGEGEWTNQEVRDSQTTLVVPDGQVSIERTVTVDVTIGFRKLFCQDGVAWTSFYFPVRISVSESPRFFCESEDACHTRMNRYLAVEFREEVSAWLSGKLQAVGLEPLGC